MTTVRAKSATRPVARPTGREEVVAAVLTAATELFAEQGPNATSIRDLAKRSGVNHGLVFRHFGTKDDLVAAVLDHLSAEVAEQFAANPTSPAADAAIERHLRVIARSILDGYPVGRLQRRFPNVDELVERARTHHANELEARVAAANTIALELGWRLLEPFLRSAAGLERLPAQRLRNAINTTSTQILEGER
jgi:AcrR family transcriptional regulator